MTKREIVKWLERKEIEVRSEMRKTYNKKTEGIRQKVILDSELQLVAGEMESMFDKMKVIWHKWKTNQDGNSSILLSRYSRLEGCINNYSSSKGDFLRHCISDELEVCSPELEQLAQEYSDTLKKVSTNYANLIAAVNSMPKSKDAAEYLKSLGFDLVEIDKPPVATTALTVQIDTGYLFAKKAA